VGVWFCAILFTFFFAFTSADISPENGIWLFCVLGFWGTCLLACYWIRLFWVVSSFLSTRSILYSTGHSTLGNPCPAGTLTAHPLTTVHITLPSPSTFSPAIHPHPPCTTMSIQPLLYRQYTALIARWPVDPLRPTLNFSDALRARVTHYFGADSTPSPSKNTGAATAKPAAEKFDVGAVKREINVLAALLEDRFTNKVGGEGWKGRVCGLIGGGN